MEGRPIITKKLEYNYFGNIDSTRGSGLLIDPPIAHGDYYKWIRDDKRTNPDVLDMLKNENNYTNEIMKPMASEQHTIYNELLSNIKEDYDSYPLPHSLSGWDSKYYYFTRTQKNKSYPVYCRIDQETKQETILVDVNILSEGKSAFDLSGFRIHDDQTIMSYGVDLKGNEKYALTILNIDSREEIAHTLPELMYCSYKWFKNTIYYLQGTDENRLYQLWKYDIYSKTHEMLYQCDDELFNVSFQFSENREYLFVSAGSVETTHIYYMKLMQTDVKTPLIEFTPLRKGLKYDLSYFNERFYMVTNKDDAINFKIMMTVDVSTTCEDGWLDFMPYDSQKYVEDIEILSRYMLISYKENGNNFLRIIPVKDGVGYDMSNQHDIYIDDAIKNIGLIHTIYDSNKMIYYHTSLKKPITYYEYNMDTKESTFLRTKEVPNFDDSLYETDRIFAPGYDGVNIPISLIYRKDMMKRDGSNPLYLYGYGSYGITVEPNFRSSILPLLNRGFIYAIAHVRGGSFLGYDWFQSGKMKHKLNTFKDFISCAEHFIQEKYTAANMITIEGRSAGGLLVGAALTMRPDLFRTVIAGVPFVDVMNTMCDPSIPLTIPEWEQWGNPNEQEYYDYIKQYSPYDNIKKMGYPNVLALGGLNDPRVGYWEPAKFIAKLREYNTNDNLLLLKTEMEQGHFGQTDRYKYMRELSFDYSFVLKTYCT